MIEVCICEKADHASRDKNVPGWITTYVLSYLCKNAAISLRQLLHCQQALKDIFTMTYIIALIKYKRLEWPSQHLYVNNDTVV